MHKCDIDIERLIKKGFARLPVDDATVARAIAGVVDKGHEAGTERKYIAFRPVGREWLYALAAALVLFIGAGYLFRQGYFLPVDSKVAGEKSTSGKTQRMLSVVSTISDSGRIRRTAEGFMTDEKSQVLLAVGVRTRAILFEKTCLDVDRADSSRTDIVLHQGAIAVDVVPDAGSDTVAVVTTVASFTQIGTRFMVTVDSAEDAGLEVYRGAVHVRERSGTDVIIRAGQAWNSRNKGSISSVSRDTVEPECIQRTFTKDRIDRFLRRRTGTHPEPAAVSKMRTPRRQQSRAVDTVTAAEEVIPLILRAVERGDAHSLDSMIARLKPAVADSVARLLFIAAEYKKNLFRFSETERILLHIVNGAPFSIRSREDASMRCYMLHKEHIETSRKELMEMLQHHRKRFSRGAFGDDMAAEAISLLLASGNSREAVDEMERFLKQYPSSPHHEYYSYVYASTLREDLERNTGAIEAYKRYIDKYPKGRYGEDAHYWIIQLSRSLHDMETTMHYSKIYLQQYPRGRWDKEVRAIDRARR